MKTFSRDGRVPIEKLYRSYFGFDSSLWKNSVIYQQKIKYKHRPLSFDIMGFTTKRKGLALWIIAGVHGEEPAGPNALSTSVHYFNNLGKKLPMVIIPLANPSGYFRDWRYVNTRRARRNFDTHSVGDAEHIILRNGKPLREKAVCNEADTLTRFLIKSSKTHPPILILNFHEDESLRKLYLYSQGILGIKDPIANDIVHMLKRRGFIFYEKGMTRFNQPIVNGIIGNVGDGSIDEMMSSGKIFFDGNIVNKPKTKSIVVIETPTNLPLKTRVQAHREIMKRSEIFFNTARKILSN